MGVVCERGNGEPPGTRPLKVWLRIRDTSESPAEAQVADRVKSKEVCGDECGVVKPGRS